MLFHELQDQIEESWGTTTAQTNEAEDMDLVIMKLLLSLPLDMQRLMYLSHKPKG